MSSRPDPARIVTRRDFADALTRLREQAGLTVRDVAKAAGLPTATTGDYFAGRHMPPLRRAVLDGILAACGVTDEEAVREWTEAQRRVRRNPGRRSSETRPPYRGLETFQPEDAEWFFGRKDLTESLLARLRDGQGQIIAVTGPSGSGKSSLLRAGLIPAVEGRVVLMVPGPDPVAELAERLPDDDEPFVVVVDQFETVLTDDRPEAVRSRFLAALRTVAERPSARVVIGLRADFYARALRHRDLARILADSQFVVGPMAEEELRQAIVGPAQRAGLVLGDGLVETLLGDFRVSADDAGALPLLSHALLATWQRRQRSRLTVAEYRDSGGIGGAVASTAESAYRELSPPERKIARQVFLRLVHIADDTADTRRRVGPSELPGDDETTRVVDHFVDHRLITATGDGFEIVHEALLDAWPRLRAWIDADRAGLLIHRRLTAGAETWRGSGRDPSALLSAVRLAEAAEWADDPRHAADLSPPEREFLAASLDRGRAEQRAAKQRTRRRKQLVAVLVVLSVAALSLAGLAFQQQTLATRQRDMAVSRQVAVEADKLRTTDPDLARQLALAAFRVSPTEEARSSLLASYAGPGVTRIQGSTGVLQTAAVSHDGRMMATGGTDRAVRLWTVPDRRGPITLQAHHDTVYSVAFSPDGRLLASGSGDGTVHLWQVAPGSARPAGTLYGPAGTVYAVAFGPDGRSIAVASADRTVRIWNVTDPAHPSLIGTPLTGARGPVQSVAFSPDGHVLAYGSADDTARLWDVTDLAHPRPLGGPLTGPAKTVFGVAFSADGHRLAVGSGDQTVRVWNVTDPAHPTLVGTPLTGPQGWVNAVSFSPDGHTLAAASSDAKVWLWHLDTQAAPVTLPHPAPVTSVAYLADGRLVTSAADGFVRIWDVPGPALDQQSPDIFSTTVSSTGHILATISGDGTARLWNIADPRHPAALGPPIRNAAAPEPASGGGTLSPDGRILVVGGRNGGSRMWDVSDPARPTPLPVRLTGPASVVQGVSFSPDERLVAIGDNDRKVWLWDVRDRHAPIPLGALTGPANYAYQPVFSPDGRTVAVGSADFRVYLWDVTDPRHPKRLGSSLAADTNYVITVAFSPDGRWLATGGADDTVLLWDLADRHRPTLRARLNGPGGYVWSLAYSGTGRLLAATDGAGSVWLWDVSSPRHPRIDATLATDPASVYSDVFDNGRPVLVTAGVSPTIRLWNLDPRQVAAWICASTGTSITRAEWGKYLSGRPYHTPC